MSLDELKDKRPDFFMKAMEEARGFTHDVYTENVRLKEALKSALAKEQELKCQLATRAASAG